jgi:hypothetical protein
LTPYGYADLAAQLMLGCFFEWQLLLQTRHTESSHSTATFPEIGRSRDENPSAVFDLVPKAGK